MADDDVAPMPGEESKSVTTELGDRDTIPEGMGRCVITGKIVPEDELIVIEGHRVCAEGKADLLQRLKSGEVLPGEMERPTNMRRFMCLVLDIIIMIGIGLLAKLLLSGVGLSAGLFARQGTGITQGLMRLVGIIIALAYFGTMHGLKGQTIGKIAGRLKVVELDGSPISMRKGYLRALAYLGLQVLTPFVGIFGLGAVAAGVFGIIMGVYGLTDYILALTDSSKQRTLHDRLTGTRVIMEN